MKRVPHIIRRQAIRLQVSRGDNHLALQQRFLRLMEEQVLPRLEPLFDSLSGPGEWVEIDKLDIDLGRLGVRASDQVWTDRIVGAYTERLKKQLDAGHAHGDGATRSGDLMAFFLEYGVLPWWAAGQRPEAIVREQMPVLAERLPALLAGDTARRRWVRQIADDLQVEAFRAVARQLPGAPAPEDLAPLSLAEWLGLFPNAPRHSARNIYWESLWSALGQASEMPGNWLADLFGQGFGLLPENPEQAIKILAAWLDSAVYATLPDAVKGHIVRFFIEKRIPEHTHSAAGQTIAALIERVQATASTAPLLPPQRRGKTRQTHAQKKDNQSFGQVHPAAPPPNGEWAGAGLARLPLDAPGNASAAKRAGGFWPEDTPGKASTLKRPPIPEPEGLLVPLAGTVLIHPFLPVFFERAGLLLDGQFAGEDARERAVHLLYHAATGLQHPAEEELPLLKLLCGMELQTPTERFLDLTDTELAETPRLFQSLATYWDALGNASPDDLRGSFLVREGKLQHGDLGWRLTVEEKTWDILLTKLPWGLSPIQHTWMRDMIWVEWA